MSWSFSIPETPIESFAEAAKAALEANRSNILQYNPAGIDQAEAAVDLATEMVKRGLLGSGQVSVRGSLSGHGNPYHQPTSTFANDAVSISLNQVIPSS